MNAKFVSLTNGFGEFLIGKRKRLSEELPYDEFCDCAADPSCSRFVTAQHINAVFHWLTYPDGDAILCFSASLLIFYLSFRIGLHR